jgi:hypothetical protein
MRTGAGRLAASAGRVRRVLGRRVLDGRFPPQTVSLLRDVAVGTARRRVQWLVAGIVPGYGASAGPSPERLPGEWRRWVIGPRRAAPVSELTHLAADAIVPRLCAVGVQPFLIEERADGTLHFGVDVNERARAADALADLDRRDGWYVEICRGRRRRVVSLQRRRHRRAARRAESWTIFGLYRAGASAVGRHHGVLVSFWAPGANDRLERVGVRGLHRFDRASERTVEHVGGRAYPGLASFPVERALTRLREPVDVVVTWVDGDDPAWRSSFDEWRGSEPLVDALEQATHRGRFTSHDELRYVLRSLWLNAGWVRRIFVVTADQRPDWLVADDRLHVVSHREIFPPDWLPTFNSHAIEARLHHIDGLAQHFIYFNDDVFLARPVGSHHFFTPNGLPKFFESEARIPVARPSGDDRFADVAARRSRDLIEREFGMVVTRKLHHAPFALRRDVLFEIDERFAGPVEATARHRFRHRDDVPVASAFANHFAAATGRAVAGSLDVVYENLGSRRLGPVLRRLDFARDADVLCVNETEHWETDPGQAVERLRAFLDAYYPVASPWEKP